MSEQEMDGRKVDGFEAQLMEALQRVDAPEGFAERVMRQAYADPTHDDKTVMNGAPRTLVMRRPRAWVGGAIAAVLVLGAFGAERVHVRRERAALATQQFEAAVLVTDQALQQTREQLAKAGLRLGE